MPHHHPVISSIQEIRQFPSRSRECPVTIVARWTVGTVHTCRSMAQYTVLAAFPDGSVSARPHQGLLLPTLHQKRASQ